MSVFKLIKLRLCNVAKRTFLLFWVPLPYFWTILCLIDVLDRSEITAASYEVVGAWKLADSSEMGWIMKPIFIHVKVVVHFFLGGHFTRPLQRHNVEFFISFEFFVIQSSFWSIPAIKITLLNLHWYAVDCIGWKIEFSYRKRLLFFFAKSIVEDKNQSPISHALWYLMKLFSQTFCLSHHLKMSCLY